MSDNSTLPATGDVVRDVQKGGGTGPKTQVFILDAGGAGTESLLTAGQAAMVASIPVVIASDQTAVPVSNAAEGALLGEAAELPTPYTINHRLKEIGKKLDAGRTTLATEATLSKLVATLTAKPRAGGGTLLHRN